MHNVQDTNDISVNETELDHFKATFAGTYPAHIAIIMDGNGRWAQQRGKERLLGHEAGARTVRKVVEAARYLGIEVLTLYAFSSQNWGRPKEEVDRLMELFMDYLMKERERLLNNQIRLRIIGNRVLLPPKLQKKINQLELETSHLKGMILQVAISYGGREEILNAVTMIAEAVKRGDLVPNEVDEIVFNHYLYTDGISDPDLLIRTSGEQRISNFMLWQIAYSEVWFTPTLWPDFNEFELMEGIRTYSSRERRFGKLASQVEVVDNQAKE